MKTIHKHEVYNAKIIELPEDSEVLSIQMQAGKIYLWALVDTEKPLAKHTIEVFGTGWDIDKDLSKYIFIGTIQDGSYVWHYWISTNVKEIK